MSMPDKTQSSLPESLLEPIWRAREADIASSPLQDFCQRFTKFERAPRTKDEYERLWRWSLDEVEEFWEAVWRFSGVIGSMGAKPFLDKGEELIATRFFPRAKLNFAENLLRAGYEQEENQQEEPQENQREDKVALSSWFEQGEALRLTRAELRSKVEAFARILLNCGVASGDRVAAVLPNTAESVIAMLGCTAIGGVWTSASPDFGTESLVERFSQTQPKVLLISDGYAYNGKYFSRSSEMLELAKRLDKLEHVFMLANNAGLQDYVAQDYVAQDYVAQDYVVEDYVVDDLSSSRYIENDRGKRLPLLPFAETLAMEERAGATRSEPFRYPQLPFDHPLCILYSSGTTGVPKCIVHRAGAVLLQHSLEHKLHCDIRADDRVFFFTTCGWMMWNWLTSVLFSGARVVLYDGSPLFDEGKRLWHLAQEERLTHFGAAAKYYAALEKSGLKPREQFDSSCLRAAISTGSPLAPESFDFIAHCLSDSPVFPSSISGGSDLCGCFVMGCPSMPVYRGEISVSVLGMAIEVVDEHARPLLDSMGELVCAQAFPTMPLKFFGDDEEKSLYRDSYFKSFPESTRNLWHQGDYAEQNSLTGGITLLGRSDATLNVGGVRIGTAEIYRQVEAMREVSEAVAVEHKAIEHKAIGPGKCADKNFADKNFTDTRMLLFVRLADGFSLDEALREKIIARLRKNCSPRHAPSRIFEVADIPRTRSGKITEIAIRDYVAGKPVGNLHALANPQALDAFRALVLAEQEGS